MKINSRLTIEEDLKFIADNLCKYRENLQNSNIFITGATGFFGKWMLETLIYLNDVYILDLHITILTRNFNSFKKNFPHLASHNIISYIEGDVKTFKYPEKNFKIIIHAATTSAEETFNDEDAINKFETIALGTKHMLDFAKKCDLRYLLLTSSGSLYGKQPDDIQFIEEGFLVAPNHLQYDSAALGEAKRVSEFYASYYADKYHFDLKIARCFAFVGPYLQMDIHYAVGNFIKDAIEKKKITIKGDGTPIRSYMYTSDLMIWLFSVLFDGKAGQPYNIGSDNAISMLELAQLVGSCFAETIEIEVLNKKAKKTASSNVYVPSIQKAKHDLGIEEKVALVDAIKKTIQYVQNNT